MSTEGLQDASVECPHCGHHIHLDIELSEDSQRYQDECPACGGDILLEIHRSPADDRLHLRISADDEQYY